MSIVPEHVGENFIAALTAPSTTFSGLSKDVAPYKYPKAK
jgi:hypothetical protein